MAEQNNRPEDRRDNRDEQLRLEQERRRMQAQRPGIGSGWRTLWIWPVVIVLILLVWFGFWGWGAYGGWFWSRRHEGGNNVVTTANNRVPNPNNQPEAVNKQNLQNGSAVLNAANKQQYVGQSFEIVRTPVLKKVSNSVFWLGNKNDPAPLLVVLSNPPENGSNPPISVGEPVDVVGQVQKVPPLHDAEQTWHLSQNGAQQVEREGAYVEASQAMPR